MRSFLGKCLVFLLALALIGGNAQARLWPNASGQTPSHSHHAGAATLPDHQDQSDQKLRCCCECAISCVSAFAAAPDLGSAVPAVYGTRIHYRGQAAFMRGRSLLPEPEPPRTSALT